MDDKFLKAIEVVLKHEGGYVNDPKDPGGETKFGISKRSYPSLDIKNLARDQAINIYHRDWWVKYKYDQIDNLAMATKTFDLSVNMGPSNAHRILQRAVCFVAGRQRLVVDGILGPLSFAAINETDPQPLQKTMCYMAAEYYYSLAKKRKESREYLFGWLNRAYFELEVA